MAVLFLANGPSALYSAASAACTGKKENGRSCANHSDFSSS